ncbi:hypothetical protein [Bradyrhizobium sp. IC3195]|nr:hypothetical protein [Bradyrhizobium sp. IC3195]
MVDLPGLVTEQFAEAPFSIIGPGSGLVQQRKHGVNPPLVTGQCVEQHPIFELRRPRTWLDQLALRQAAFSDMPVEHAPLPNTDVRLLADDIHEICEGLGAPEHQAELSVGVNQIGHLTTPFGMHVEHDGDATLISAEGPRANVLSERQRRLPAQSGQLQRISRCALVTVGVMMAKASSKETANHVATTARARAWRRNQLMIVSALSADQRELP